LLHHKLLYGQCHKQHHEYKAPVGIVAAYCHPFEMLVSNVIPLFAGALIANSHLYTVYAWILFAVLGTQSHHCGYHWPWMFHDHQPSFHGAQPVNNLHRSYNPYHACSVAAALLLANRRPAGRVQILTGCSLGMPIERDTFSISIKVWFRLADYHHEKFDGNFGMLTWLDRLHNTDRSWIMMHKARASEKAVKHA
jgi:sterol desaturase/sphingolipid hydroxylase (fatty acid hydroxylase superfamily)